MWLVIQIIYWVTSVLFYTSLFLVMFRLYKRASRLEYEHRVLDSHVWDSEYFYLTYSGAMLLCITGAVIGLLFFRILTFICFYVEFSVGRKMDNLYECRGELSEGLKRHFNLVTIFCIINLSVSLIMMLLSFVL